MNKQILLSIQPKWVAKILNGEKTIEVRKRFPKKYVGWVYIYCTKDELLQRHWQKVDGIGKFITYGRKTKDKDYDSPHTLNGKVIGCFYCDNVEEITTEKWSPSKEQDLLKASCLTENQLFDYCNLESGKPFYAIHISKLEIFDEPKELTEFGITKSPQNYCYIKNAAV